MFFSKKMDCLTKCVALIMATAVLAARPAVLAAADTQQGEEREIPTVVFENLSIGTDQNKNGPDGRPLKRIISDLFYIDYPSSWSFGQSDYCSLMFYYQDPSETVSKEFQDFFDDNLNGDPDKVAQYVESGGINGYLKQVLGTTITSEYQLVSQYKEDIVLMYSLQKDGRTEASVVIWTFGKLSIRVENISAPYNPSADYGDVLLFPETDDTDFTSIDAIRAYVEGGNLNFYTEPFIGPEPSWAVSTYKTDFHEFYRCEGETDSHRVAVFIPVTPDSRKNWILVFETHKFSTISDNAYSLRESLAQTFQVLK